MDCKLNAGMFLMLLVAAVAAMKCSVRARILDEMPPVDDAGMPPVAADMVPVAPVDPPMDPVVVPPVAAPVSPATVPPFTGAVVAADVAVTFFMHDILGGTKPSARIVTGVVASSAANGNLPFAKPNVDIFPIQGAVPLPDGVNNVINSNNVPYIAGIGGTTTPVLQSNGNTDNGDGSNTLPFVNPQDLPSGITLQNLLFGTTTVIDDEITEGHELGKAVIGRAQGFYIASSQDGTSKTVLITAMLGEHGDTISFFGVHRTAAPESHISVIGGTGKYENARGFAAVQTIHLPNQQTTDGVETLLQFSVHLCA